MTTTKTGNAVVHLPHRYSWTESTYCLQVFVQYLYFIEIGVQHYRLIGVFVLSAILFRKIQVVVVWHIVGIVCCSLHSIAHIARNLERLDFVRCYRLNACNCCLCVCVCEDAWVWCVCVTLFICYIYFMIVYSICCPKLAVIFLTSRPFIKVICSTLITNTHIVCMLCIVFVWKQ